jgi:hypothetical protein
MRFSGTSERHFASLDYGKREVSPTDMNPDALCVKQPRLATGIVILDILVANQDRHEGNIKVDSKTDPTSVVVFDHDQTLFGRRAATGVNRLNQVDGKLGFTKLGGQYEMHKVAKSLHTSVYFDEWVERAESIPDRFINEIVDEAAELGLTATEVSVAKQFLRVRKRSLRDIIKSNKPFFPISDWGVLYQ